MQQLVERVLARRPRLAEDDLARRRRERVALDVDALAVALHLELLDVAGEERQGARVGQDRAAVPFIYNGVEEADEGQHHRQVLSQRRVAEM